MGNYDSPEEAKQAYARTLRSALCLSGGGIRSATFNLGVLQGLARHGLLQQFDYLSTVSGGGFIGGWLSAWLHRRGMDAVIKELTRKPPSPVDPEPEPIYHLRVFSNYLSPRHGLLSADTWTLVSTLLRNLMLMWLVFVPFLLLGLMVPRAWMSIVSWAWTADKLPGATNPKLYWCFVIGVVGAWIALTYAGLSLSAPKKEPPPADLNPYKNRETGFLLLCLLPGIVSAAAFATYWARVLARYPDARKMPEGLKLLQDYPLTRFVGFALALVLIPWLFTSAVRFLLAMLRARGEQEGDSLTDLGQTLLKLLLATLLIGIAQGVAGAVLHAVAIQVPHDQDGLLYATFSVPLILSVLMLGCALIVGFTSTLTMDEELEWWARAGAWFMIAIVGWVVVHLLVLFGPSAIISFKEALATLRGTGDSKKGSWESLVKVLTVVGGVVSGVITLVGGFSGKTPANDEEAASAGLGGRLLGWLTNLLAPLFFAFLMILLALGTNWLLASALMSRLNGLCGAQCVVRGEFYSNPEAFAQLATASHRDFVAQTPLQLVLLTSLFLLIVGSFMGMLINTNRFSLHYMWRDRIIRAYLGASRAKDKRNPQPFTNFDTNDNVYMCELRRQPHGIPRPEALDPRVALKEEYQKDEPRPKLFHVLNLALNLAGGDKLAWQDRKAESFTVSPLHAGSYWLGYRRSLAYGGDDGGISLGTAVAISGAFVSPNMGYMMTSPVVRFLMTLFNVRFGWWLGNPGAAGDETYWLETLVGLIRRPFGRHSGKPFESASPLLSVRPIVAEAFGKTDDKAPYVYLSDGGHFENLGLYEMVLRRCRFIVVCDASTDAGYSFDSLAQSIRQIRVDLGVPIEMRDVSISPPSQGLRGKYCSVGKIRYSCVDRNPDDPAHANDAEYAKLKDADFDGTLIYIKASMIGEEPRDVINYGRGSKTFPQEIIVDQWFSEAQFESYRALGSHIIDKICSGNQRDLNDQNQISLTAFERKAKEHNQLNLHAFKERADDAALAAQIREELSTDNYPDYRRRVKQFLDDLL